MLTMFRAVEVYTSLKTELMDLVLLEEVLRL